MLRHTRLSLGLGAGIIAVAARVGPDGADVDHTVDTLRSGKTCDAGRPFGLHRIEAVLAGL